MNIQSRTGNFECKNKSKQNKLALQNKQPVPYDTQLEINNETYTHKKGFPLAMEIKPTKRNPKNSDGYTALQNISQTITTYSTHPIFYTIHTIPIAVL